MLLHELSKSKGLNKEGKRLGRGDGSGKWNYCTRGIRGQKSRSGGTVPIWFEGGQTPLFKRLPKLSGFKRHYKLKDEYIPVNLGSLDRDDDIQDGDEITKDKLKELGYINKTDLLVKILAKGDLSKELTFVGMDGFSKTAEEMIEQAGGEIQENDSE